MDSRRLTDDCQLVTNSGRRWLWSADVDTMYRTSDEHPARRQELRCRRSTVLEHFASGTPSARHWTCYISAASKNPFV